MATIGIIGGSGVYDIEGLRDVREVSIKTPFGNPSDKLKTGSLEGRDVVTTPVQGFGGTAKDHQIRIDSGAAGAGMVITADRPLSRASLWSIRSVVSMEPFIALAIEPGSEFTWTSSYRYYTLPPARR
jgi:hypothetical protein